jgi:next-to-BRCA1 protein 1
VQPQARHAAWCNACKKVIAGVRYKCMHPSCPDYDLCADCEALPIAIHPALHPLLKMKTVDTVIPTVYRVGQTTLIPRLQPAVVQEDSVKSVLVPSRTVIPEVKIPVVHQAEIATSQDSPSAFESGTSEQASSLIQFDGFANEQTVVKLPPSTIGSSSPLSNETLLAAPADRSEMTIDEEAALLRLQENLRSISVTPTIPELVVADTTIEKDTCRMPGGMPEELAAPMTPTSETKDGAVPEMIQRRDSPVIAAPVNVQPTAPLVAKFISDLNIADGQVFPPGAEFVKSWVLENAGSRHWPEDTELRFVAGDRMGTESKTIIGGAPAGSEVTISTPELKAPETPGRYVAYWRLFDGEGFAFGTSVWIE